MKPGIRRLLRIAGWTAGAVALAAVAGGVFAVIKYQGYEERAAKFDLSKIEDVAERSAVYDANGELYSYFGGENRLPVPLSSVSRHFINALLAREDSRFWQHHGIDFRGMTRAILANVAAGQTKQGASTITQQLARNACGLGERSIDRKLLEAVLARRIEAQYPKEKILELYVNRIYFGSGCHGVETAARSYFGKPAADLTLGEGATLAALIRNPKRLAPSHDLEAATAGRDAVLARMKETGAISSEELAAAKAQQLKVIAGGGVQVANDAIMDAVTKELSTLLAPETLEYGGLRVTMTIDPALQRMAEAAADRRLGEIEAQKDFRHPRKKDFVAAADGEAEKPTNYLQVAVVMIENRTGAIRAALGGRDFAQSKYQRALDAKRQIGSTFKPFVYAAAFERGLLPGTFIDDAKITAGEYKDLPKKWSPENSDGEYGGLQPAANGLLKSRNTMSVRVGEYAGLPKVREVGRAAGLSDSIPDLPVIFLGGFESTARDVTAAYTVFPNLGVYRPPYLIAKVEDHAGQVLWEPPKSERRVISAESAWMTTGILQQVMKSGTAAKAGALGWKKPGAGKTGTTNKFFDAWFVGFTSSMTCGVWVGLDQPDTIMEKGYGAALALPIWVDVMEQVPEKQYPAGPLTTGVESKKVTVCAVSGEKATNACVAQHYAYDMELPVSRIPTGSCRTHVEAAPVVAAMPTPSTAMPSPRTAPLSGAPTTSTVPAPPPQAGAGNSPQTSVETMPVVRQTGRAPGTAVITNEPTATASPTLRPPQMPSMQTADRARAERVAADRAASTPAPPSMQPIPARARTPSEASTVRAAPPSTASASPDDDVPHPASRVEVRRAIPVEQSSSASPGAATATTTPEGESVRTIVEHLPDGRTRTTTIRSVKTPASAPQQKREPEEN